jgi:hypothetical protein
MCWHQLFFSIKKLSLALLLISVITSCSLRDDDVLPAAYPLSKGEKLRNAALISIGMKEIIINTNDNLEQELKLNEKNRPKVVTEYSNFGLKYISQKTAKDLTFLGFSWQPTSYKKIMVAIFDDVIKVENNEISNKSAIKWLWTSQSDKGSVLISEGKISTFQNDKFILSEIPKTGFTLKSGSYVWCIWAWDDNGLNIVASSREIPFKVIP